MGGCGARLLHPVRVDAQQRDQSRVGADRARDAGALQADRPPARHRRRQHRRCVDGLWPGVGGDDLARRSTASAGYGTSPRRRKPPILFWDTSTDFWASSSQTCGRNRWDPRAGWCRGQPGADVTPSGSTAATPLGRRRSDAEEVLGGPSSRCCSTRSPLSVRRALPLGCLELSHPRRGRAVGARTGPDRAFGELLVTRTSCRRRHRDDARVDAASGCSGCCGSRRTRTCARG